MGGPKLAFSAEPSTRRFRLRLARYQGLAEALAGFTSLPSRPRPVVELLDVGVGNGRTYRYCEAIGVADRIAFHGIDNSARRLSQVHAAPRWQLMLGDVQSGLPFPDSRFDVVVCEQLLEHVPDPRAVAGEMVRVLAPGGLLVIGVPIFPRPLAYLRRTLVPRLDRITGARRDHVSVFTIGSIRRLLGEVGVIVREARGFRMVSGGPLRLLEDWRGWYQFNRWLGRRLPGMCIEVQVLATKPPDEVKEAHLAA
jgi:SAM-dependent methyltransferase